MEHKRHLERSMERKVEHYFKSAFKIFFFILFAIAMIFLVSYVVMWLWNWLMPELFSLPVITYWQAFGLLLLAKIFFGFGGNGPSKGNRNKKSAKRFRSKNCDTWRKDFSEWKLYDEFWEKEGEQAFQVYVNKKKEGNEKGENNAE